MTALGGAAGAATLLLAPAQTFQLVVPFLIAGASVLLAIQPRIKRLSACPEGERSTALNAALFGAAVYVGTSARAAGCCCSPCSASWWMRPWPGSTRSRT